MVITCPSCQEKFEMIGEEPDINRRVRCPHCLNLFEVTWLYPFTLDFIEDELLNSKSSIDNFIN